MMMKVAMGVRRIAMEVSMIVNIGHRLGSGGRQLRQYKGSLTVIL
jgi:hypothetical protein